MFSNDFSLFALFTAGLAALTSAYHAPVGDPSGNPINKPSLGEIVPVGKPYTITWTPTTTGPVTILLLRGPSTNVVPIGAPIASGIDNTGTFEWTPPTTLEPDTARYGIQLIVDATGQYQYSTQFGITNPSYSAVSSGASSLTASVTASAANSTAPSSTPAASAKSLTPYGTITSHHVASTGSPANSSIVLPTKSMSVPSSLLTSATGAVGSASATAASATSAPTGAASHVRAGLGLVAAVAGLVMAL